MSNEAHEPSSSRAYPPTYAHLQPFRRACSALLPSPEYHAKMNYVVPWRRFGQTFRGSLSSVKLPVVKIALVCIWFLLLRWGERTSFEGKVASCDWDSWETWVGATHCMGYKPELTQEARRRKPSPSGHPCRPSACRPSYLPW